jgi:hypothetical protein
MILVSWIDVVTFLHLIYKKKSVSYPEVSHLKSAAVRILPRPIGLIPPGLSPQVSSGSNPARTDRSHTTRSLASSQQRFESCPDRSLSYHEVSCLKSAAVRILLTQIWMCERVCQFTCGRSLFYSPHIHCIMYVSEVFLARKTDLHHWKIVEHMAKNASNKSSWLILLIV